LAIGWAASGVFAMLIRVVLYVSVGLGCSLGISAGQEGRALAPAVRPSPAGTRELEFPLVLQQKVVAGKTPVGTHVQSNLLVATLLNGKVIPRNAVLSGEVVESQAKTSSQPSRLSIRLDSAHWKNESVAIRAYLAPWYYSATLEAGPNLQYGPEQSAKQKWNGMGQYPDPNAPEYRPFPAAVNTKEPSENTPSPVISKRRAPMKGVECQRDGTGGITLVGNRSNIKLDKLTTYVFAGSDLAAGAAN
jgi:hypothetical protein